jgi:hypothetical protein
VAALDELPRTRVDARINALERLELWEREDVVRQAGAAHAGATDDAPHSVRHARPERQPLCLAVARIAATIAALVAAGLVAVATVAAVGAIEASGGCQALLPLSGADIPPALAPIYPAAAARYGLGVRGAAILAAINWIETGFGRDLSTSSAGAVGFMQFMPSTWAAYGVDANGDGKADPRDPQDAIFSAARYLRANGAPGNWTRAILAYNHADWYVRKVLAHASGYGAVGASAPACIGAAGGRLGKLIAEANRIDALRSHYVYGGGHVTPAPATPPWDCSSSWSRILQVAGYRIPTMTSSGFMSWGDPGPGAHVTIYATPAHVYGTIDGRAWGTGASNPRNPGGGPAWLPYTHNPVAGFPGGTPTVRHPPGL